jgi:MtN3 and saliva related transmembrane protein
MSTIATVIGLAAAVCTTVANLPQLKTAWITGQTDDLSLKTLLLFGSGMLWIIYGLLQRDVVIMLANGISLLILSVILYLKVIQERARYVSSAKTRMKSAPVPETIKFLNSFARR